MRGGSDSSRQHKLRSLAHLCRPVGFRFDFLDGSLAAGESARAAAAAGLEDDALLERRADGGGVAVSGGAVPS